MINYHTKNTQPFVKGLIEEYGIENPLYIEKLSAGDLERFARILKDDERDLSFLLEHDFIHSATTICLRTGDNEDKIILADLISSAIINHYKPIMQELISDTQADMINEYYELSGHKLLVDEQTGEKHWVKLG